MVASVILRGCMTDLSESGIQTTDLVAYKNRLVRLLIRLVIYYLIFAALTYLIIKLAPGLSPHLPVGGLADYASHSSPASFERSTSGAAQQDYSWVANGITLFMAMLLSLLLMIPVAWVHAAIHSGHDYDHSIDETALVLPSVVAGVVMVVQHSLALAFSLAGIVAGVRFRRALSDTFDTLFIFVAIGVGLAAGVSAIEIALIITVFFNFSTVLICIFGDGLESRYAQERRRRRRKRKERAQVSANTAQESSTDTP